MTGVAVDRTLPDPAAEPTINVKRAAAVLGISVRHAYVGVERGEIPSIKVGTRIVVPTARFLALLFPDGPVAPSDNGSDGDALTSGNGATSHGNLTPRGHLREVA